MASLPVLGPTWYYVRWRGVSTGRAIHALNRSSALRMFLRLENASDMQSSRATVCYKPTPGVVYAH